MRLTAALLSAMVGISAPLLAQKPTIPSGPISLIDAITIGRRQGVEAAIAQLNVRAAEARKGQRLADLLPNIEGQASYIRQTINLDAFTNAQSSVIAAQDALIQARVGYGTARVGAYRVLGVIEQLH